MWNEITEEWFYINNPPSEWHDHFFHNKRGQTKHWWLSGERWFLEPASPKWSLLLRTGSDPGENGWKLSLSDKGSWMRNQATGEFFLIKEGFSQSITSRNGLSQWQQDICSDQQGSLIHYWFSKTAGSWNPSLPERNGYPLLGVNSSELLRFTAPLPSPL